MSELLDAQRRVAAARDAAPARGASGRHARPRSDPRSPSYRADIEGLRAVAVLGVLIYHAGAPFLPGGFVGVDVFFVISGYLITGLIHDEIARTGRLSLLRFYARRIKRLLPAATAVLTLTAVAATVALPPIARATVGTDVAWATLYGANWRFASEQTDYFNEGALPSPVLHYWSLAVEEQYYLLWPVLLGVLGAVALRRRGSVRFTLFAAMALLGSFSYTLSLYLTHTNQPYAFFGTPARVWELAVGGCLTLAMPVLSQLRAVLRAAAGWAGLAMVVGSMVLLHEDGTFPGTAALWPTVGTALVILAGAGRRVPRLGSLRAGPVVALDRRFMRHTGRISYSLYLWHWPPLVLMAAVLEKEHVGFTLGLVVLAVTWPVAWLSWALLEEPFRRSRALGAVPARAFGVAVLCSAAALASAVLLHVSGSATEVEARQADGTVLQIDPASAREDDPSDQSRCMMHSTARGVTVCTHGPDDAERTVALVGDSHAIQWWDAMSRLVDERGWRLVAATRSGCVVADVEPYVSGRPEGRYPECVRWRDDVYERLTAEKAPDVVVLVARATQRVNDGKGGFESVSESYDDLVDGFERTYRRWTEAGSTVVAVASNPDAPYDVPECLSREDGDVDACTFSPSRKGQERRPPEKAAAKRVDGAHFVDLAPLVCPDDVCAPVQRGTIVYRDTNHMTNTFVLALLDDFERELRDVGVLEDGDSKA